MATIKFPANVILSKENRQFLEQKYGSVTLVTTGEQQTEISFQETSIQDVEHFINDIQKINADVSVTKETYPIENLSCSGCASSASKLLNNKEGVMWADVRFDSKTATIYFSPDNTSPEQLADSLKVLGYQLVIH
jgi:copper chaperone CopZ